MMISDSEEDGAGQGIPLTSVAGDHRHPAGRAYLGSWKSIAGGENRPENIGDRGGLLLVHGMFHL